MGSNTYPPSSPCVRASSASSRLRSLEVLLCGLSLPAEAPCHLLRCSGGLHECASTQQRRPTPVPVHRDGEVEDLQQGVAQEVVLSEERRIVRPPLLNWPAHDGDPWHLVVGGVGQGEEEVGGLLLGAQVAAGDRTQWVRRRLRVPQAENRASHGAGSPALLHGRRRRPLRDCDVVGGD